MALILHIVLNFNRVSSEHLLSSQFVRLKDRLFVVISVLLLTQLDFIPFLINEWNRLNSLPFLKVDRLFVHFTVGLGDSHSISLPSSVDSVGEIGRQAHVDRPWKLFAILLRVIREPIDHEGQVCDELHYSEWDLERGGYLHPEDVLSLCARIELRL